MRLWEVVLSGGAASENVLTAPNLLGRTHASATFCHLAEPHFLQLKCNFANLARAVGMVTRADKMGVRGSSWQEFKWSSCHLRNGFGAIFLHFPGLQFPHLKNGDVLRIP